MTPPKGDKYEAELQRLLAECGGDWEALARALFNQHPTVTASRNADREALARSFAPSHNKRGRKPQYGIDEVFAILDRLAEVNQGRGGRPRYSNRKAALGALSMKPHEREQWEKRLAGLGLQPWNSLPLPNPFDTPADDE